MVYSQAKKNQNSNRCDTCNKVVPKDAARVEAGKTYTCAICLLALAKQVEDKTPEIKKHKNLDRKIRHKSYRGNERSLATFDVSNPFKVKEKKSSGNRKVSHRSQRSIQQSD